MADVRRKLIASLLALVIVAAVLVTGCRERGTQTPEKEKETKKAPVEEL